MAKRTTDAAAQVPVVVEEPRRMTYEDFMRAAQEQAQKTANAREALLTEMVKTCTHCGKVKSLATGFSERWYTHSSGRRYKVPQSWCKECRNSKDSHPTRYGVEKKKRVRNPRKK